MALVKVAWCYCTRDYATTIQTLHPSASTLYSAVGQCFRFTTGCDKYDLVQVKFNLKKVGLIRGTMKAALYACTGSCGTTGKPTGAPLAMSNSVFTMLVGTVVYTWITFTFPIPYYQMDKNTWYVIVVYANTGTWNNLNYIMVRMEYSWDQCLNQNGSYYNWGSWKSTSRDHEFEVWGECVVPTGFKHSQAHIIGQICMVVDPVTGLTEGEEKEIKAKLMSFYAQNNITPIYQGGYWSFASTARKQSTQEAQITLNKWNARGLNKTFLLTIARDICNKNLV